MGIEPQSREKLLRRTNTSVSPLSGNALTGRKLSLTKEGSNEPVEIKPSQYSTFTYKPNFYRPSGEKTPSRAGCSEAGSVMDGGTRPHRQGAHKSFTVGERSARLNSRAALVSECSSPTESTQQNTERKNRIKNVGQEF